MTIWQSSLAECSNLGHQHPAVVRAIQQQAERLCFVTSAWGAQPRAELAQVLLKKAGFEQGRVFFTLAGADANENAVKFARQVRGLARGWVITRDHSYDGPVMPAWLCPETRAPVIRLIRSTTRLRTSAEVCVSLPVR